MKKWYSLFLVSMVSFLFSSNIYAQYTATWALTSAKTVAVTGAQAAYVVAAQMVPGSTFTSGTHNSDGFSCKSTAAWPTTATDGMNLDFPLSPDGGSNMTVTGLTMGVKISGSSGSQMFSLAYQVDGAGSWTALGTPQEAPSGGSSTITFASLTGAFPVGHTYVVRMYSYAKASGTSASRTAYVKNVAFAGAITDANTPTINLSIYTLPSFGTLVTGTTSTSQTYTVTGIRLTNDVVLTAQSPFLISLDDVTYSSSLTLAQSGGALAATTVYVKFSPATAGGSLTGAITHTSVGAVTRSLAVNGTAVAIEPTTQSSLVVGTITGTSVELQITPGNGKNRLIVACERDVPTWTPTDGKSITGVDANFTLATNQGSATRVIFNAPDSVSRSVVVTGLSVATNYQFAVYEYNGNNGSENYFLTAPGTASITTLTVPGLTVSTGALSFGNVLIGSTSAEKMYTISGKYLAPDAGSISLSTSGKFEISLTTGTGFGSSLSLPYSGGVLGATNIYVHFLPDAVADYSASITNSGGGATDAVIKLTGFGRDSSSFITKAIYISPDGNDATGTGSIDKPYKTMAKAALLLQPDYTLVLRGGTYINDSLIVRDKTLTNVAVMNYPGEHPIIDGSGNTTSGIDVILWYANNSTISGLEIIHATHNAMWILGNGNVISNCSFHHGGDAGFKLGAHLETIFPRNNFIVNCDAYENYDKVKNGGNADGFAAKWNVGSGNRFALCRSWENSDDGWDLWQADSTIVMDSCWCFRNGYDVFKVGAAGNGNGFKIGGAPVCVPHIMRNCISFDNKGASGGKGFDQNSNFAGHTMLNCLSWGNSYLDYNFYKVSTNGTLTCKNSIQYKGTTSPYIKFVDGVVLNNTWPAQKFQTGSTWKGFTVTDNDFVSVDTSLARLPRNADGTLQSTDLYKLKSTSQLIDQGLDVGIPFSGKAPDIAPFEYGLVNAIKEYEPIVGPRSFKLEQNYPNPFNPSTVISYTIPNNAFVSLKIYNVLGKEVATLVNEDKSSGIYHVTFDASHLPSGMYVYSVKAGKFTQTKKMLLIK